MKTISAVLMTLLALVISSGAVRAQAVEVQKHQFLKGEFVIRDVIQDTKKAEPHFPAESPFAGSMYAVKVEFVGDAPEWFDGKARWVQTPEIPERSLIGIRFKGEVHSIPKYGLHFPCFSSVYIVLKKVDQEDSKQPSNRPESESKDDHYPRPEPDGANKVDLK